MAGTGADIQRAIREFRAAGWTVARIAADLGVHRTTVYRWNAGTRRPNRANQDALTEAVDMQYARENGRRRPRPLVLMHLEAAHTALEDPAERAEFEARMRVKRAAIVTRRARFEQRRDARRVERRRRPVTSITRDIDPFALVGEPEPALPF